MTVNGSSEETTKYKLRIIFDGVIAVGPPEPERGDMHPGPIYGVMAASTRRKSQYSIRKGDKPVRYIPTHIPTIFTTMTPAPGSRLADESFQISDEHPKWNIWHPVRERLEFRFDGKADVGDVTFDRNSGASIPLAGGRIPAGPLKVASINNVPHAQSIWSARSVLKEGLLSSADDGVRAEAAAQILVPWGDLCAAGLFEKSIPVDVFFDPQHDTGGRTRAVLPNTVVTVEASHVEIAAYSLDDGQELDSLVFQLQGDSEMWISNGDPTDTDIHLKKLSEAEAEANMDSIVTTRAQKLQQMLPVTIDTTLLKTLARIASAGSGLIIKMDPSRITDEDLDFELFGTLFVGPTENAYPIAKRPEGKFFGGPNCMNIRARCHEEDGKRVTFKSDRRDPQPR